MCIGNLIQFGKESVQLKNFQTLAELQAWVDLHDEEYLPPPNLCDDYAELARELAEIDGYRVDRCLVCQGKTYYATIFAKEDGTPDETVHHIGNAARVLEDQSYWYFDINWKKLIKLCNFVPGGIY